MNPTTTSRDIINAIVDEKGKVQSVLTIKDYDKVNFFRHLCFLTEVPCHTPPAEVVEIIKAKLRA